MNFSQCKMRYFQSVKSEPPNHVFTHKLIAMESFVNKRTFVTSKKEDSILKFHFSQCT